MSFNITNSTIALLLISLISVGTVTFLLNYGDFYGVEVPEEYQDSYNNYNQIQEDYSQAEQDLREGDVDAGNDGLGFLKSTYTALKQLGNIGSYANSALNDVAKFLHIPNYFIVGFFTLLAILITASILAFLGKGARP